MKKPDNINKKAKSLANSYFRTHDDTYLEREDFEQEAILAHLEGKSMKYRIIDAYMKAAPLSRDQVGVIPFPEFTGEDEAIVDGAETMDNTVLISQLRDIIAEQFDDRALDIIDRHYLRDETLTSIGKHYKITTERVRQIRNKVLEYLRRFADGN